MPRVVRVASLRKQYTHKSGDKNEFNTRTCTHGRTGGVHTMQSVRVAIVVVVTERESVHTDANGPQSTHRPHWGSSYLHSLSTKIEKNITVNGVFFIIELALVFVLLVFLRFFLLLYYIWCCCVFSFIWFQLNSSPLHIVSPMEILSILNSGRCGCCCCSMRLSVCV